MKMFVFPVGGGHYDTQNVVVMAETMEQAEQAAIDHLATRQGEDREAPNFDFYFNPETWALARETQQHEDGAHMTPYEVQGNVALVYGVDG